METENQTAALGEKKPPVVPEQKITPFLWFDGKAEEAANFYTSIFRNSKVSGTMPGPGGSVMSVTFQLNGHEFIAMNAGPMFSFSPAISFFVTCHTEEEIDDLWGKLSESGKVLMELDQYPFSEKYGWTEDKFGLSWQLSVGETSQDIAPSLLFVGNQFGKAEEAIHFYTSIFQNSDLGFIARYTPEDDGTEGAIKYASFSLNGQEFSAMDSDKDHAFTFTPAISLFVKCETQPEIDSFWEKLSAGGEKNRCGWLQDKFGVSWQIVPPVLGKMLSDPDREKSKRVMEAMLQMDKMILKDLENAYNANIPGTEPGPGNDPLIINRVFNSSVSSVWQAWTEPESLKKWWGPKGYTCPFCSIDLKTGGKFLGCMRSAQGDEYWSTGTYKEIAPHKKLVCTDSFSDPEGNIVPASDLNMPGNWPLELLVTVTFEEADGKTKMHLRHEGLPPEIMDDCKASWEQSFDKMEENLR